MLIDRNNKIFKSNAFLKEQPAFYVFQEMITSNEKKFMSDENNYIIGQANSGYPIWIWTIDSITSEKMLEIENILKDNYLISGKNNITCKKELFEFLVNDKNYLTDYHEIGFLLCEKLNDISLEKNGYLDKANYGDKIPLAHYWIDNCDEIYPDEKLTFEESLVEVENWLYMDNFYVWRNSLGKPVSMACVFTEGNEVKISHVFTPKKERKKGYCLNLIYELTKELLDNNKVPLLYTDHNYTISNHTYEKIGYKEKMVLVNININK